MEPLKNRRREMQSKHAANWFKYTLNARRAVIRVSSNVKEIKACIV